MRAFPGAEGPLDEGNSDGLSGVEIMFPGEEMFPFPIRLANRSTEDPELPALPIESREWVESPETLLVTAATLIDSPVAEVAVLAVAVVAEAVVNDCSEGGCAASSESLGGG